MKQSEENVPVPTAKGAFGFPFPLPFKATSLIPDLLWMFRQLNNSHGYWGNEEHFLKEMGLTGQEVNYSLKIFGKPEYREMSFLVTIFWSPSHRP